MNRNSYLARALFASMYMMSATEGSTGGTATEAKSAEQIAQEKAEADAAKKAAAEQAKKEKAEAAAKAKAEKAEASAAAKKQREEAAAAAKAEKDKQKAEAAEAKKAAAEAKAKEREEKATKKEKVVLVSQRGVTQPKAGTKTRAVWDLADQLSAQKNGAVAISELMPVASGAPHNLNDATIRTQYARWKQFHGVYGQVAKAAAPAAETSTTGEAPVANDNVETQAA